MATPSIKEEARRLVEKLPGNSTWEDLVHEIYVRQAVEAGLADSQAGRTTDVNQVRSSFDCRREGSLDRYRNKPSAKHSCLHRAELTRVRPNPHYS